MRIMVFDIPASSGGALTILHNYYKIAQDDLNNHWIFVLGEAKLVNSKNIEIYNFKWAKKNWFLRLYFDFFISRKIVRKYNPDQIISLQNVIVPGVKIKQILYLHQPIPFTKVRFKFYINPKFWVYQNIISLLIFRSIRKADSVIVQTEWMADACVEKTRCLRDKIMISPPELNISVGKKYSSQPRSVFFYPASELSYKNHNVIIRALNHLKEHFNLFEVVFTLNGSENRSIRLIKNICKENDLPVKFIGPLKHSEVLDYYTKSILVFPSYIETFGLPLLEARMHNTPIISSNTPFSKEILNGYDNVSFFDPFDDNMLANLFLNFIISRT